MWYCDLINSIVISVCDHNTMSGLKFVVAVCSWMLSYILTTDLTRLSFLVAVMPPDAAFACFPGFPTVSLTKLMNWAPFPPLTLHFLRSLSRPIASSSSAWFCLCVYLPAMVLKQHDKICSSVALLPHSLHNGPLSSSIYTDWLE